MKNQNQISGKLFKILPLENGVSKSGNGWKKQNIVIDTSDQYNPHVCLTLFGDKTDLLKNYKEGDNITCSINISSREYNEKWYNQLDCRSIASNEAQANNNQDDLPY